MPRSIPMPRPALGLRPTPGTRPTPGPRPTPGHHPILVAVVVAFASAVATGCGGDAPDSAEDGRDAAAAGAPGSAEADRPAWTDVQDSTHRVAVVTGLDGPEAVRYDPEEDVWLVSSFGPSSGEDRDANGYVSRVSPDGSVDSLRFATGTPEQPLHMPRGMFITGDTLWVADVDGVHGFDRRSGEAVAFVDFRAHEPGFLNDIAAGPDGALYVTDTGLSRIYRIEGREAVVAVEDPRLGPPNGITWDGDRGWFVIAPWGGEPTVRTWVPGGDVRDLTTTTAGFMDGVEIVDGRVILASQADSSLHVLDGGEDRVLIRVPGAPADIGVDTRRRRVAVPYVALGRVDVWTLPEEER